MRVVVAACYQGSRSRIGVSSALAARVGIEIFANQHDLAARRTEEHHVFLAIHAPSRFDQSLCPDLGNCRLWISKGIHLEIEKAKSFPLRRGTRLRDGSPPFGLKAAPDDQWQAHRQVPTICRQQSASAIAYFHRPAFGYVVCKRSEAIVISNLLSI